MILNTVDEFFILLDEQALFQFTGLIKLTEKESQEYVARVIIENGNLAQAHAYGSKNFRAVYKIGFKLKEGVSLSYKIEPGPSGYHGETIALSSKELARRLETQWQEYQNDKKLAPPMSFKFKITDNLMSDIPVDYHEFLILKELTKVKKVTDIYKNSPLLEYEVSRALVSLKNKNLIKANA